MEVEGTPSGRMAQGVQGQGFRTEGRLQDLKRNPVDRRRALTGRHLYNDELLGFKPMETEDFLVVTLISHCIG